VLSGGLTEDKYKYTVHVCIPFGAYVYFHSEKGLEINLNNGDRLSCMCGKMNE